MDESTLEELKAMRRAGRWKIVGFLAVGLFLAGLLAGVIFTGGGGKMSGWLIDAIPFTITSYIVLAVALSLVAASQWVRNQRWFDGNGAAREMARVRDRIGTRAERANDSIAVAIQYAGTTILLGIVIFAYFEAHG